MDREIIKVEKYAYYTKIYKISKVLVKIFMVYNIRSLFPQLCR